MRGGKPAHIKVCKEDGPTQIPGSCAILLGKKGWLTFIPYVPKAVMLKCKDVSASKAKFFSSQKLKCFGPESHQRSCTLALLLKLDD